jgi:hypothetical protein
MSERSGRPRNEAARAVSEEHETTSEQEFV